MKLTTYRRIVLCAGLLLPVCGCARDPANERMRASFDAARAQCGITIAESADVQRCMRAKGWVYRLPWQ